MITREIIDTLKNKIKDLEETKVKTSDMLILAKENGKDIEHDIERSGKTIKLKEKTLWDEVFLMGTDCDAGKLLATKYPELFESFAKQEALAEEIKKYSVLELGFDCTKMTIANYLQITEDLVNLLLDERNTKA